MSFFGELRRRNVFRVGIAYLATVWVLIQVADTVLPVLNTDPWILQALVFSAALGFPLALVLAWFYELTPDGVKATVDIEAQEPVAFMGRKIDFAIIGALVLALGFVVADSYLLEDAEDSLGVLPNSVAVLPFENLSPDPDNSYFAAGIHETILNELAKLRNMNVIARTSVLRYADGQTPIPEIARVLNVGTVMEGSVQYAEGRILVTAQLIDPATSAHLWSENYDREFADIFAIQADIALNIANALETEFSLDEQETIEKVPTESPGAYAVYLRALSSTTDEGIRSALNQAIALDPNFALAYATRAGQQTLQLAGVGLGSAPDDAVELESSIYEDAQRALSIDATLGTAHAALAAVHQANWRGSAAEQEFQRAVQLSPNDSGVLFYYARFKRYRGDFDEAIRLMRRVIALDPNRIPTHFQLGLIYRDAGQWDAAAAAMQNTLNADPANLFANINLGMVEAARGNIAEAERRLQLAEEVARPPAPVPVFRLAQIARGYALAGRQEDARRLVAQFEERALAEGVGDAWWATAYIAVGDSDQALLRIESAVHQLNSVDQAALSNLAANPWGDPVLNEPEFRELLDNLWNDE